MPTDVKRLVMYVHMHWGYNHPYAARTWTIDDWRSYAHGLKSLGYNTIMFWPMGETLPDPLTPSDEAFLGRMRDVIRMVHEEVGLEVWVCVCPNTVGNDRAADYTFETRPFFSTDLRLNPGDPREVDELMRRRRMLFEYIREADAISVIDSDPGGYIGSTNAEFAGLLQRYMEVFGEYSPAGKVFYWMLMGWEAYNKFWEEVRQGAESPEIGWEKRNWYEVVSLLKSFTPDNWGLFASHPLHLETVDELGVVDRTLYLSLRLGRGRADVPLDELRAQRDRAGSEPARLEQDAAGSDRERPDPRRTASEHIPVRALFAWRDERGRRHRRFRAGSCAGGR